MKKSATKVRTAILLDPWSLVHLGFGILFGMLLPPLIAVLLLILWEPLEVFVISPLLAKRNIVFGFETFRNSLSDILVDSVGVVIGAFILR